MKDYSGIYNEYARQVYQFLLNLTKDEKMAEDLTQETFYQAYLHIGKFEHKCSLYTWLCQIGKNAYFKEYNRKKKLQSEKEPLSDKGDADFISNIVNKDEAMAIHKILHKLPEPYKEVFTLRVFSELKFKDIGNIFEKNEIWAKATYYRAKEKIIKQLKAKG